MKAHLKATGIYLTHMAWVSLVLLTVGKQPFPNCVFQAALILLGVQCSRIIAKEWKVNPIRVRRTR